MKEFNWLTESYEPKEVVTHSNRKEDHEKFDRDHLARMGYHENSTIHYSVKKGKTTLLGNPYMHEGM